MAVRSAPVVQPTLCPAGVNTSLYDVPGGLVALIKGISICQLTLPSTANPYLLLTSAGGGYPMPLQTFGGVGVVPYADWIPFWSAHEPGDNLTFVNTDSADWAIALFGALLEM